jgi:hypothetical protein
VLGQGHVLEGDQEQLRGFDAASAQHERVWAALRLALLEPEAFDDFVAVEPAEKLRQVSRGELRTPELVQSAPVDFLGRNAKDA